jgi:hypothetical protein
LLWPGGGGLAAFLTPGLCRRDYRWFGCQSGLSRRDDFGALFWQFWSCQYPATTSSQRTEQIQQLLQNPNFPAETMQIVEKLFSLLADPFNPFVLLVTLVFKGVACGILTTLGGVVGAAFWGKPKIQ